MLRELPKDFQRTLVAKSHTLRPVVMIGIHGLTENVHNEVDAALTKHELIKMRISSTTKEVRAQMITELATRHKAYVIHQIGHTIVLYRSKKDSPK